jgi:hypothetical protein
MQHDRWYKKWDRGMGSLGEGGGGRGIKEGMINAWEVAILDKVVKLSIAW